MRVGSAKAGMHASEKMATRLRGYDTPSGGFKICKDSDLIFTGIPSRSRSGDCPDPKIDLTCLIRQGKNQLGIFR